MTDYNYTVLFPIDGENQIIMIDEERQLKIIFTISFAFEKDNQEAIDFILNDIISQMKEISNQYDALDVDQYIN